MIDPKVVELSIYNGIPHLLDPGGDRPQEGGRRARTGRWREMTEPLPKASRSTACATSKGYNARRWHADERGTQPMPQIVIIIDELADLMMVAPRRGRGRHLPPGAAGPRGRACIWSSPPSARRSTSSPASSRPTSPRASPSPSPRRWIQPHDPRHGGAEKLLGNGDMLFVPIGHQQAHARAGRVGERSGGARRHRIHQAAPRDAPTTRTWWRRSTSP